MNDSRQGKLNRLLETLGDTTLVSSRLLDAPSRAFLESIEREAPDFNLIGLPHASELPGVRRKLTNLGQRSAAKRTADYEQLADVLGLRSST